MALTGVLGLIAFAAAIPAVLCDNADLRLKRGQEAARGDLSFVVRIEKDEDAVCSGVLVGRKTILTPKKCLEDEDLDEYRIILRAKDCNSKRCEEVRAPVSITTPHPTDNDVILVTLDRVINKQKYKTMKRLSEEKDLQKFTRCKVVSFSGARATTNEGQGRQEADVDILPVRSCSGGDRYKSLCLNIIKAAVCEEDEGAPILCKYDDRWHVAGLITLDKNCQKKFLQTVRVSYFKASILQSLFKDTGREPSWNGLRVTWSPDPTSAFESIPRTRGEAETNGWVQFAPGEGCDGNGKFKGERYIKDNDMGVIILFDQAGYIAGMQIGFPKDYTPNPNNFPTRFGLKNTVVIQDNGDYFLTAYFVEPANICSGRTAVEYAREGTGTGLRIQNGLDPDSDYDLIPETQESVDKTLWTKGPCIATMGVHYWYNTSKDADCDELYPMFLLYNDGRLNSFGWAIPMDLNGVTNRVENPPPELYTLFFDPVPDCLYDLGTMSTLHIYLTDTPTENNC